MKVIPIMVTIYARLVSAGRKTIDTIPVEYKEAVQKELGLLSEQPEESSDENA